VAGDVTDHVAAALGHVRAAADGRAHEAHERIAGVLARAGVDVDPSVLATRAVAHPIGLNFHPDRLAVDGRLVARALHDDGVYRSQFVTGISNGGLTAHPGGDRDRWEELLFGGAYQRPGADPTGRPVYGGLDLLARPDGPCPRFGSCHLRLRPHVAERATYCFGDSHTGPADVGTADSFSLVLAALLEAAERDGSVLAHPTDLPGLVRLLASAPSPVDPSDEPGRALDHYIEVQVHGPLEVAVDAHALVVDPSFRGTEAGDLLEALAERHRLDMAWHRGFELTADEVPPEFRGPEVTALAHRIVRELGDGDPRIHAELVGRAARSVVTDPGRWADHAPPAATLQHLKQLWHVLVHVGRPATIP
jgi:hypothetical protein